MMSKLSAIFTVGACTALLSTSASVSALELEGSYSYRSTSYSNSNNRYNTTINNNNVTINYKIIAEPEMRASLSRFERTMVSKWRASTPEKEQKRRLLNLRYSSDYDNLADEMFKDAIMDDLFLNYANDESAKATCRCPWCCGCWLDMCAPSAWDANTKNMYWAKYLENARKNGYDTRDLGNMYNRGSVVKELQYARRSYFGSIWYTGGPSVNVNIYGGVKAAQDAVESLKEACKGWKGALLIAVCVIAFLFFVLAVRARFNNKRKRKAAIEEYLRI